MILLELDQSAGSAQLRMLSAASAALEKRPLVEKVARSVLSAPYKFMRDAAKFPEEPKSTDAALFTNDLFGLDKPRNRSGKTVLFPLDKTYQSNKGIVRCCF